MAKVVLFLVVMVAILACSNAQKVCNLSQQALQACKPSVAADSPTAPSQDCCTAINALSPDDVQCLCDYKTNKPYMLRAFGVDPARCTKLPGLCGSSVQVPC